MTAQDRPDQARGGLRERKRQDTLRRITDAGLQLFIRQGYDATTMDQIAVAAGVSRRTVFHYLRSKDEILLSLQSGLAERLVAALAGAAPDGRPLATIRAAIISVSAAIPPADMIVIDGLMRSSEAVQARKQANYVQLEQALVEAMRDRWPAPERAAGLRLVAMAAVGAMRLATDTFAREGGSRPITEVLNEAFDALEREI